MEPIMDPISQYHQAMERQQSLIEAARHERRFQQAQRQLQAASTSATTNPLATLLFTVGCRLETLGRSMQRSRQQNSRQQNARQQNA